MIELFINKLIGVPTGARINQVNSIESKAGNTADLVILIAFTEVISIGGVVVHEGVEHPPGFVAGLKSFKQGLEVVV
jgi:hypothetical protein